LWEVVLLPKMMASHLMQATMRKLCAPKWRQRSKPRKLQPKRKLVSRRNKSAVARRRKPRSVVKRRSVSALPKRKPNVTVKSRRRGDACRICRTKRRVLQSRLAHKSSSVTVTTLQTISHLRWKRRSNR